MKLLLIDADPHGSPKTLKKVTLSGLEKKIRACENLEIFEKWWFWYLWFFSVKSFRTKIFEHWITRILCEVGTLAIQNALTDLNLHLQGIKQIWKIWKFYFWGRNKFSSIKVLGYFAFKLYFKKYYECVLLKSTTTI